MNVMVRLWYLCSISLRSWSGGEALMLGVSVEVSPSVNLEVLRTIDEHYKVPASEAVHYAVWMSEPHPLGQSVRGAHPAERACFLLQSVRR